MRVTVWNEFRHERTSETVSERYPDGIHAVIAEDLREAGLDVHTATLDEPEHGLTRELLEETDVLVYWGHEAHDEVDDAIVERAKDRVLDGMGFVPLHSAHESKLFRSLMGTTCSLNWREAGEKERIWIVEPAHPIAAGLDRYIDIPETEMYGERFDVPAPDTLVTISWFEGGEVFRSGCCYRRGNGRIFYFRPGHETYPVYHNDEVLQVIRNGVRWAGPVDGPELTTRNVDDPLEPLE